MMSWSAIFLGWEGWLSMELALPCAFFPWVCSFVFTGESPGRRGFFLQPMLYVVLHCGIEFKRKSQWL